jgi:hypothetical protein
MGSTVSIAVTLDHETLYQRKGKEVLPDACFSANILDPKVVALTFLPLSYM